jgi:thioredoxin 1
MTTQYLINNRDYIEFTEKGRGILIFTTTWCKAAVVMSIIFEKMAAKYKGFLKFAKIDVDNYKEIISKVKVGAVPEFMIFKNGVLISRQHITKGDDLEDYIERFREREALTDEIGDY